MTMQRIFKRIESLEGKIKPPPKRVDWDRMLEDSGFYGQNRAGFEAFLNGISYQGDFGDLDDDELLTLEAWVKLMDEQVQSSPVPYVKRLKYGR